MHVGHVQEDFKYQDLSVDQWKEVEVRNDITGEVDLEDILWTGEKVMEEKSEEKYLGDIISIDGRNLKNIRWRIAKGKGIVDKILNLVDAIPLEKLYFEIGIVGIVC